MPEYVTREDLDKVSKRISGRIDDMEDELMSAYVTVYEKVDETNNKYAWIKGGLQIGLPLFAILVAVAIM